jgi:hypothetical protein
MLCFKGKRNNGTGKLIKNVNFDIISVFVLKILKYQHWLSSKIFKSKQSGFKEI